MSEIVYVQNVGFLVNQFKEACRYETRDKAPLAPGYYFALWPARARSRQFDESVRYFGPFPTREAAHVVRTGASSFNLLGQRSTSANPTKGKNSEHSQFVHASLRCA